MMPSTIRPGTRVKARVGCLQVETDPAAVFLETVATTFEEKEKSQESFSLWLGCWSRQDAQPLLKFMRVLWADGAKTCDHSVFAQFLPVDYLPSTRVLSNLFESGKYNNTLQLSERAANSSISSVNTNSGKYYDFSD